MKRRFVLYRFFAMLAAVCLTASCSVSRFIPEDEYLLNDVKIRSTDKAVPTNQMQGYVQQHPNSRWFSLLKVPMGPYLMSGRDSTKRINRFLQRIGEAPVIYSQAKAQKTTENIKAAVRNMGFLRAEVDLLERRKGFKLNALYDIKAGERYWVTEFDRQIADEHIREIVDADSAESKVFEGMPFDLNVLDAERTRLNRLLRNNGYYLFNKDFIRFEADTTLGHNRVALSLVIDDYRTGQQTTRTPHRQFYVKSVATQ